MTTHKEEAKARIAEDKRDRDGIKQKLNTCSTAVTIGTEQMKVFESRLPQGLYETITKKVVTMDHARKHVKVGKSCESI